MRVVDVNENNIKDLRARLPGKLKNFVGCKFLVFEEENGKIIGASGIAGIFNVHGLELLEEARGKGLGKALMAKNIEEAKKRGYSFICDSINPENIPVVKLVKFF